MPSPTPRDEEIVLNPKSYIVSRTDPSGVIQYGNDYFVEISGYTKNELVGKPHSIVRHPDMPRAVFKFMWDRINDRKNIFAVVKNLAKDGRYYWVITEFESKVDPLSNEIVYHSAFRKAAPKHVVEAVKPLYKKMLELEAEGGMAASERYLVDYLEQQNKTYDEFINDLIGNSGIFKMWFATMKKLFGGQH